MLSFVSRIYVDSSFKEVTNLDRTFLSSVLFHERIWTAKTFGADTQWKCTNFVFEY